MRIGIHAAQAGRLADPAAVRAVAVAAEQVGYSSVWAGDDPSRPVGDRDPGADLDPLAVLAASATVTSQVRLGAGVLIAARHRPEVLARAVRSLDVLSEGRLTIGLRAPTELVTAHLDELAPPGAPRTGRPPVLVAAATEVELDIVARRADGWIAEALPIHRFEDLRGSLFDQARSHGRDPADLDVVVRADITHLHHPTTGDRTVFTGDLDQVVGDLVAVSRVGADEVILHVTGDCSLDELLATYADLTEAVGALVPVGR